MLYAVEGKLAAIHIRLLQFLDDTYNHKINAYKSIYKQENEKKKQNTSLQKNKSNKIEDINGEKAEEKS